MSSNNEELIKTLPLQKCVQKYVEQPQIRHMVEGAVWLGNDETHYVKKWNDKDITDLKHLIDLTVYYIAMSLKAEKYMQEMIKS